MSKHLLRAHLFIGKDFARKFRREFYFLLLLMTLVAATPLPASGAGLVGYWNFDQGIGSTATDLSGNNNTGVLINGPLWTTGKMSGGLSFDGVDAVVEVEHSASLNISRELTISAWIYNHETHDPLLPESEYHVIAAKGWAPDGGGSWTLGWDKKTDTLFFCVRRRSDNGSMCASFDSGNLTTNWHFVTGVFSNGRIRLYVDGALAAGVNLGAERMNSNTEPVHVGSLPSSTPDQIFAWHGYIDDVRVYNAALNDVAIASLYQGDDAIVSQKTFNFTIANSGNVATSQGSALSTNINTVLTSGTSKFVSFSVSGLPANATSSFSSSSCSPSCSTVLTVRTNTSTQVGTYTIKVTGQAGGVVKTTSFNLSISQVTIPTVAAPTITPGSGSFTGAVSVSMQNTTSSASIYYTTDGSTPTQSSTPYAGTVTLTKSTTVKAKAFRSGYTPSPESRASLIVNQPYDFSLANSGNASIAAGSSASNQVAATLTSGSTQPISFSVSGLPSGSVGSFSSGSCSPTCSAVLNITTGGSTPAGNYGIVVTATGGGVTRTTRFILSVTAAVSLVVAPPTITPDGGSFSGSVSVSMTTATSGASIYYTTDGATPTQSSTLYTGPMTLTSSGTVKAATYKSGYNPSTVASASFTNTSSSTGKVYYVATNGSDTNPGTHSQPFRTIIKAYSLAVAGDTIIVKPGVYTEYKVNYGIHLDRSGTASEPITLKSEYKWQAIIDGGNKSDRPTAVRFTGSYNVLDGFEIRNGSIAGVAVWGNYNRIINNNIHRNGNYGDLTSVYGHNGIFSSKVTRSNAYIGNHIHHNGRLPLGSLGGDHGLYLCGDDELVANNIVVFNTSYGLQVAGYDTVSKLRVYNNVFAHNGRSGIVLWQKLDGVDIRNNIFYKNLRYGINSASAEGSGVLIDRNMFFGNPAGNINLGYNYSYTVGTNYTQDPEFVSDTSDFRLKSTSPAIEKGVNLAEVPIDFEGASRPRRIDHDIGAYEY